MFGNVVPKFLRVDTCLPKLDTQLKELDANFEKLKCRLIKLSGKHSSNGMSLEED